MTVARPGLATLRQVDLHGRQVACREVGSGDPVVVLVHGLGATMDVWDDVVARMAPWCTALTPDLPGHGRSDAPNGDYSLGATASVVRDLLDALGHRSATIVGHSHGGGVAMQFGYQFPERVDRLVLVSSGGLGNEISPWLRAATLPGADLVLRALASRPVTSLRRLGRRRPAPPDTGADAATARRTFLRSLRAVADHRGQSAAGTDRLYLLDRSPTMLVWGGHDRVIPVVHAERAHRAMPGSRLEVFADAGHCPHLDEPSRFADVLCDFVSPTVRRPVAMATAG